MPIRQPPVVFKEGNTSGFQLLSYSGCLQAVSFDIGNSLIYRELVAAPKRCC